jgi:hypothetical protein
MRKFITYTDRIVPVHGLRLLERGVQAGAWAI